MISRLPLWAGLTVSLLVVISILSLWPLAALPDVPGTDKIHHFIAYAVLALPLSVARPRHWLWGVMILVAYSGVIELIQPYVNRYGEWLDLLANGLGLCLGGVLSGALRTVGGPRLISLLHQSIRFSNPVE